MGSGARVAAPLLATLLAAATMSGCARPVSGTASPEAAAADKAMAAAYDRGIGEFEAHFGRLGDERAKVYNYFTWGDTKRTNEFESAKLGNPPATLVTKRRDESDDNVLTLHPAGVDVDYVRLDRAHANLAPTPWVSLPTAFPKDLGFDPHSLLTSWVAIKLDLAINQTKLDAPDQQQRTVTATGDGYELHSGATLGTMIDQGIATVPEELKSKVTREMKATVLPVRMNFGPTWEFRSFEVAATVPGEPELRIQLGYEVAGTTAKSDFPAAPAPAEVTAITDKAAVAKFYDDLSSTGAGK
ncbi:MAG: hypothetical protein ACJ72N_03890 [Labedaea sp.]